MMKRILLPLCLLLGLHAYAQNIRWDSQATTTNGVGQLVPVLAQPGAHITFYLAGTLTPATTYQSQTSTTACPIGTQVVGQPPVANGCVAFADKSGNFGGWFQPGTYQYTINSNGPYYFSVGGSSGGGGGANFPTTPGIVYNTTTAAARNATSADLITLLGYTPVNPTAIPATTNLFKGNGVAGGIVAATPGTDYVIPSALTTNLCTGGISCPLTGTTYNFTYTGGAGSGNVSSGVLGQVSGYQATGTTVAPATGLWWLNPGFSLAQINTLFAAASGTVIIPDGTPQVVLTNTNNVNVDDIRLGVQKTPISYKGGVCDASFYGSGSYIFTSGSNQVTASFFSFTAADVGKTIAVTGLVGTTVTRFLPMITAVNVGANTATISTNAPFSGNIPGERGTMNTAPLQAWLTQLGTQGLTGQLPSNCGMLTDTLAWNNGQSFLGDSPANTFIAGIPGSDILQNPDAAGLGNVSRQGLTFGNVTLILDNTIDTSKPWQSIDQNGTITAKPAIYRPLAPLTGPANNPLAPGWALNATNGVASITQGSAVICYATAGASRAPVVGQQIIFRDTPTIFKSTISSLSGSGCIGATAAATMAAALPNTTGYTIAQAEWVSTSAVQNLAVAMTAGANSFPKTITAAISTAAIPAYESNVATHGRIKIGNEEYDYQGGVIGVNAAAPYTFTLTAGPATTAGWAVGTAIVPMNPCYLNHEVPWPVVPTINSSDSTPSGATYFPAFCGGNAAISMPQANANVYVGTGFADAYIRNVVINVANESPNPGGANQNSTMGYYVAGDNASYGTTYDGIQTIGEQYDIVQGPASIGQHGVAAVGPTGDGNHYSNLTQRGAVGMIMDQFENSTIDRIDGYSTLYNPVTGAAIGTGTAFMMGNTYDEQTGAVISNTAQDLVTNVNWEPENGSHQEIPVYAELDSYQSKYMDAALEGVPTLFGGSQNIFDGGQCSAPSVNYGSNNQIKGCTGGSYGNLNAGSQTNAITNWGTELNESVQYGIGGSGPFIWGTNNVRSASDGWNQDWAYSGNFAAPFVDAKGGSFWADEFVTNRTIESNPMNYGPVFDPTAVVTGQTIGCVGSTSCFTQHFGGNQLVVIGGGQNRIPADKTDLVVIARSPTATTMNFFIFAEAGPGCTGALVTNATVPVSTTWSAHEVQVDFTGQTGCNLGIQVNNPSSLDLETQLWDFIPMPSRILLRNTTYTAGAACTSPGILGIDATAMYLCPSGSVVALPLSGGGGGGTGITYYVDNVLGSDSNNGTTVSTPFATIAKINSTTLTPGTNVAFKSGDTWHEQLTVAQSGTSALPITYTAYGTGAKPVITASDLKATGWALYATNVWRIAASSNPGFIDYAGQPGIPVASAAAVISPNDFFWDGSSYLYVYSLFNPSATVGIEARSNAIYTTGTSYITVTGLELRGGLQTLYCYGSTVPCSNWTIQNNLIETGYENGIQFQFFGGIQTVNNVFTGNTLRSIGSTPISEADGGTNQNLRITNNTITNVCQIYNATTQAFCDGVQMFSQSQGDSGYYIAYNTVTNSGVPGAFTTTQYGGGIHCDTVTNCTIEHNVVINTSNPGVNFEKDLTGLGQYNLVINGGQFQYQSGLAVAAGAGYNSSNVTMQYNTAIGGWWACAGGNGGNTLSTMVWSSNVCTGSSSNTLFWDASFSTQTWTNNNFGSAASCFVYLGSTCYNTYGALPSPVGTTAIAGTPLFTNPSLNDYTQTASSPTVGISAFPYQQPSLPNFFAPTPSVSNMPQYDPYGAAQAAFTAAQIGFTSLSGDVIATGNGPVAATVKGINNIIMSGLATGLIQNTTGTGAPSIAQNFNLSQYGSVGTYLQSGNYAVPCTTTPVFDLSQGDTQTLTLTTACGTVTNSSLTNLPTAGSRRVTVFICQDSTGGHTFPNPTWSNGWTPPTLTANGCTSTMFTATSAGLFADGANSQFCNISSATAACGNSYRIFTTIPAGTNTTQTVNTTSITAISNIIPVIDISIGAQVNPAVVCNTTTPSQIVVTARTPGTGFTVEAVGTTSGNPTCVTITVAN